MKSTLQIVIHGNSAFPVETLAKEIERILKRRRMKVSITGDINKPPLDGFLEDETVEIQIENDD